MDLFSTSVYLHKYQSYDEEPLLLLFEQIIPPFLEGKNLHSLKVLLKPNLITARMGSLACTEGRFIIAAAKWFIDNGADVLIGDSPAFGTAQGVLRKIGINDALQKLPVRVSNFTQTRQLTLSSGITVGVAIDSLDCDQLINLPRVKAHAQMRLTLGVKNLFGCVVGMRKPWWHMVYGGCNGGFADHLVELLEILPPGITLVDGITAMHETGPIIGTPFQLGIVGSAANPVAMDRAFLAILGVSEEKSPIMIACRKEGLVGADFEQLTFPHLHPAAVSVDSFQVPEVLQPIRFNPFRFIRNNIKRIFLGLRGSS